MCLNIAQLSKARILRVENIEEMKPVYRRLPGTERFTGPTV